MLGARDLSHAWPSLLQQHYGRGFSVARRLALLLTFQRFLPTTGPIAMRSSALMTIAVRVMANLVTDDDADWVARAVAGRRAGVAAARSPTTVQLSTASRRKSARKHGFRALLRLLAQMSQLPGRMTEAVSDLNTLLP